MNIELNVCLSHNSRHFSSKIPTILTYQSRSELILQHHRNSTSCDRNVLSIFKHKYLFMHDLQVLRMHAVTMSLRVIMGHVSLDTGSVMGCGTVSLEKMKPTALHLVSGPMFFFSDLT